MISSTKKPYDIDEFGPVSTEAGGFAEGMTASPMQMYLDYQETKKLSSGKKLTPEEIRQKYPYMTYDREEYEGVVDFLAERKRLSMEFQKSKAGAPLERFTAVRGVVGGMAGSIVDPVGNALAGGVGIAARAGVAGVMAGRAALAGTSAAVRATGGLLPQMGLNIAENFAGNMAIDAVSSSYAYELNEDFDWGNALVNNLGASTVFGMLQGAGFHYLDKANTAAKERAIKSQDYFKADQELGEALEEAGRGASVTGREPMLARKMFDTVIAAENSATTFQYAPATVNTGPDGRVNLDGVFFSTSGIEAQIKDFYQTPHSVRTDISGTRGIELHDNANIANNGKTVFRHSNFKDLNIIDGEVKLKDLASINFMKDLQNITAPPKPITERTIELPNPSPENVGAITAIDQMVTMLRNDTIKRSDVEAVLKQLKGVKFMNPLHEVPRSPMDLIMRGPVGAQNNFLAELNKLTAISETLGYSAQKFTPAKLKKLNMSDVFGGVLKTIRSAEFGKLHLAKRKKFIAQFEKIIQMYRSGVGGYGYEPTVAEVGGNLLDFFNGLYKDKQFLTIKQNLNKLDGVPTKLDDMTLKDAYKLINEMVDKGLLSKDYIEKLELEMGKKLGVDGFYFRTEHFRGNRHAPTQALYVFDKYKLNPDGAAPAKRPQVNIGEKLDEARAKFAPKEALDIEDRFKTQQEGDIETELTEQSAKLNISDDYETMVKQNYEEAMAAVKDIERLEGHLDPATLAQIESARELSKKAGNLDTIINTIKGCLR